MATATNTKPSKSDSTFDLPSAEEATQHIRDLGDRLIESSKSVGRVALDANEKALQSLVDFENKAASVSQLDWASALATVHAKFIADVGSSYAEAARQLLK